jgi:transposase
MDGIVPKVPDRVKRRIIKRLRKTREAGVHRRCLIMVNLINGRSVAHTARVVGVAESTVRRVVHRFIQFGEAGLLDGREDNGEVKLDERYLSILDTIVRSSPQAHGYPRPTWTRELLVETMKEKTGVAIHVATMSRALKQIRARRGRPRPTVNCPWPQRARNARLAMIRRLVQTLPRGHVAVYEDEVDIHLNPKIGLDWMGHGQQKEVPTPGRNVKRYVAGAMNAKTGRLTWVEAEKKNSMLFILLLHALRKAYPRAKVIHIILDNYKIHSSAITQAVVASMEGRIRLHFLPPYCPDHNKIERLWLDLHAEVTRNHRCLGMDALMGQVRRFLKRRSPSSAAHYLRKAA